MHGWDGKRACLQSAGSSLCSCREFVSTDAGQLEELEHTIRFALKDRRPFDFTMQEARKALTELVRLYKAMEAQTSHE